LRRIGGFALRIVKRFRPPRAADFIHVTLREDRAQPRAQFASAVEIIEKRSSVSLAAFETIEFSVKRIRQIASHRIPGEGASCAIKFWPEPRDEMFPRSRVASGAAICQRDILKMKCLQVRGNFSRGCLRIAKASASTSFHSAGEILDAATPVTGYFRAAE